MSREASFQSALANKELDAEILAASVQSDPKLLESLFQELTSKIARVKFGCSKSLMLISEQYPSLLYPKIEKVFSMLDSPNQILKWNAIAILGNLAAVDSERRIRSVLPKLYAFLSCGELITANNTINALGKIGRAFPEEQAKITSLLLKIERAAFETDECRNIAIGKSILALQMFVDPAKSRKDVKEFARAQIGNRRPATAAKAKSFLKKIL